MGQASATIPHHITPPRTIGPYSHTVPCRELPYHIRAEIALSFADIGPTSVELGQSVAEIGQNPSGVDSEKGQY